MLAVAVVLVLAAARRHLLRHPAAGSQPPVEQPPVSVLVADFENRTGRPDLRRRGRADAVGPRSRQRVLRHRATPPDGARTGRGRSSSPAPARIDAVDGAADSNERRHRRASSAAPSNGRATASQVIAAGASTRRTRRSRRRGQRARATDKAQGAAQPSARWPTTSAGRSATPCRSGRPRPQRRSPPRSLEAMRRLRTRLRSCSSAEPVRGGARASTSARSISTPASRRAYSGMAGVYANYFRQPDKAAASYEAAMKHLDRMSEREKYRTLGTYYLDIVAQLREGDRELRDSSSSSTRPTTAATATWRWPTCTSADIQDALTEVRKSLEIYPKNSLQRYNYAMYSMYAGDLRHGDHRGRGACRRKTRSWSTRYLPEALSQLAQGGRRACGQRELPSPLGR